MEKEIELITSKTKNSGSIHLSSFLGVADLLKTSSCSVARLALSESVRQSIIDSIELDKVRRSFVYWKMHECIERALEEVDAIICPGFSKKFNPLERSGIITHHSRSEHGNFHSDWNTDANMVLHKPVQPSSKDLLRRSVTLMSEESLKVLTREQNKNPILAIGLRPDEALFFGAINHRAAGADETGLVQKYPGRFGDDHSAYLASISSIV